MTYGKRILRVLNLGAGVQSTTVALMSAQGRLPRMDFAVFADTQEEPQAVYDHLQWLVSVLPFPVLVRTAGKLGDDLINGGSRRSRGTLGFASIPAFTSAVLGQGGGMLQRQCTKEYKIEVVEKAIRRDILGLSKGERVPKDVFVEQYFGLSFEEPRRIAGVRLNATSFWREPQFPLWNMEYTRRDCIAWLARAYPGRTVPRSACVFCPYRSNEEWLEQSINDLPSWHRAVQIDHALRGGALAARNMVAKMYIHRQCVPLDQADLRAKDERQGQLTLSFGCEGMCGT